MPTQFFIGAGLKMMRPEDKFYQGANTSPQTADLGGIILRCFRSGPGDGRARAFLNGGAGDAAFELVRIAAGKLDLAALHFADFTQDKGLSFQVLLFCDGAFFQFYLKVEKFFFERSVVCPLLFRHLEQGAHNEVPAGEGRE